MTTRRELLRLLGLAGLAGTAAACAGAPKAPTTSGEKQKTFSVYWNAGHAYKAYDKVIADFEKAHGVTVNLNKQQWPDLRTRLLADFASGQVPDVVEEPGGWVQEFAVSGDAQPLQSYVDKSGAKIGFPQDWQPGTVERNSYKGKVYGVQLHYTCTLLLYNKAMLADAGVEPPTTWPEFLAAAKRLTADGVHGVALNQDAGYSWPWLLQNGVEYYNAKTGDLLPPHEAAVEALQFQADLVHKHKVSPVPTPGTDYSGPQKLLSANRAAMILTGPWDLQPIAQTSPDLELGIAAPLRHKTQATVSAGTSLFVPTKAKSPDLSWDFISRITALEVESAATKEVGMLMPRRSWAELAEVKDDERYKAFSQSFPFAVDQGAELRLTGKSGEVGELYKTLYQTVVMRNTPAKDAVATFVDAAKKVLGG